MKKVLKWLIESDKPYNILKTEREIIIEIGEYSFIHRKVNKNLTVWKASKGGKPLNEFGREADLLNFMQQVFQTI